MRHQSENVLAGCNSLQDMAILGPGDTLPEVGARSVLLLDEQWYPETLFTAYARTISSGEGVSRTARAGVDGYCLNPKGLKMLRKMQDLQPKVLFFASSDTHVETFLPMAALCRDPLFVIPRLRDHAAETALTVHELPYIVHHTGMRELAQADVAILGNDWAGEERLFIARCRKQGLPTVCLQESVIDLNDCHRRMCWADFAFVQGIQTVRYLDRGLYFLTGNPRYDALKEAPLPRDNCTVINCNFTFGVFQEASRQWIEDVIDVLKAKRVRYFISRHPRDQTDLSGIENVVDSSAGQVHQHLEDSSILITRFSSLAHEAVLMGRQVVYYNPHGERMRYLNEDDSGLIAKAYSREELEGCLEVAVHPKKPSASTPDAECFQRLFVGVDGNSHRRCLAALSVVSARAKELATCDYSVTSSFRLNAHVVYRRKILPWLQKLLANAPGISGRVSCNRGTIRS